MLERGRPPCRFLAPPPARGRARLILLGWGVALDRRRRAGANPKVSRRDRLCAVVTPYQLQRNEKRWPEYFTASHCYLVVAKASYVLMMLRRSANADDFAGSASGKK